MPTFNSFVAALAIVSLQPAPAGSTAEGPPAPVASPAATDDAPAPAALDSERPVATPRALSRAEVAVDDWNRENRRLKLHAGLSGGFAGALVLTGALLFIVPSVCSDPHPDFGCGEHIVPYIIGAAMFPLALIPTGTGIYWGVRIHRHKKAQPTALLRPSVGGFSLQF